MRTTAEVVGAKVVLRPVVEDDAKFIWGLRNDPTYNSHLSTTTGTADDQRAWIRNYKSREAAGTEYYFIIERQDDHTKCGTVRVYNINNSEFTWGSWILNKNKPNKAAIDSAMLVYRFGFNELKLVRSVFDVRKENSHTLRFHDRFGATRTGEDNENIYFVVSCEDFKALEEAYISLDHTRSEETSL